MLFVVRYTLYALRYVLSETSSSFLSLRDPAPHEFLPGSGCSMRSEAPQGMLFCVTFIRIVFSPFFKVTVALSWSTVKALVALLACTS